MCTHAIACPKMFTVAVKINIVIYLQAFSSVANSLSFCA